MPRDPRPPASLPVPTGSRANASATLGDLIGPDALLLVCVALAMIALCAVIGVIRARREAREAARAARLHSEGMRELLRTARMAESIAGIGVWQYDHATGKQDWSAGLRRLFGIEGEAALVAGDAETLLFANGMDLIGRVRQQGERVGPFLMQFDLPGTQGAPRSLVFHACNLRNGGGRVHRTVAVVRSLAEDAQDGENGDRATAAPCPAGGVLAIGTDPLTGLANRFTVMRDLDRMVVKAHTHQSPLALVLFRIDRFETLTETCRADEVDAVRRKVARIAGELVRPVDIVGRVGEGEFAWAMPGSSGKTARIMAERMRQAIARTSGAVNLPAVTISSGYACLREGESALGLFARADQALNEAARHGRNRVRVAA